MDWEDWQYIMGQTKVMNCQMLGCICNMYCVYNMYTTNKVSNSRYNMIDIQHHVHHVQYMV